ncbi:MAG: hypothetical protein K2M17_01055 [Bacilli bacterium]|nr:hypothetical protein [Bacilli bacterium]
MKKRLGIILTIFVFLLSITSVDAAVKKGDKVTFVSGPKAVTDGINYGSKSSLSFVDYTYSVDGKSVTGYCLDPNLEGSTYLKVDRILGDGSDRLVGKYDAALLAILKNGYVNSSSSFGGLTGTPLKAATDLAIRALTLGTVQFGKVGKVENYSANKISGYINLGAHWAALYPELSQVLVSECATSTDYNTVKECFNKRNQKTYYESWFNSTTFYGAAGTTGEKVLNAGRDLYKLGLEAAQAYDVAASGSGSITVTELENIEFSEPVLPETKEIWKVVNFNIKGASDSQYVKNVIVVCDDDCAANGFTIGTVQYKSGSDWVTLTDDVDLTKYVDANGNVQIRFEVTQDLTITSCTNAHYKLSYNENISSGSSGLVGIVAKEPGKENTQRYVMLIEVGEATTGEDTKQEYNGKLVCDGNPDDHEPEDPEPETCHTVLSSPICDSDADGNSGGSEGYVKTDENVKKCILNNVDDAKNSYQLTGSVSNNYCSVFSKEDYSHLKMQPVVENVKCGGYFKLNAHVEGTKDCYTSGGPSNNYAINKTKYESDIVDLQKKMIEAYDTVKAREELNRSGIQQSSSCADPSRNYIFTNVTYSGVEPGSVNDGMVSVRNANHTTNFAESADLARPRDYITWNNTLSRLHISTDGTLYDVVDNENGYDITFVLLDASRDFTANEKDAICDEYAGGEDDFTCNFKGISQSQLQSEGYAATCVEKRTIEDYINDLYDGKDPATTMRDAQDALERAKDQFNACTKDWDNEYKFDPTITFDYEGGYKTLTDKLTTQQKTMEKDGDGTENKSFEICLGDVTDNYECQSNLKVINSNDEINVDNGILKKVAYTVCTVDGCTTKEYEVSQAKYVKKSVSKSQDYITPKVFYQVEHLGKISIQEKEEGSVKTAPLQEPNGLPVATTVTGGGRFWMYLQDLGEFYDKSDGHDNLGRLIDYEGENVDMSVAKAQENAGKKVFDGKYVCYFESPCRPDGDPDDPDKGCPTCDYKCEPKDDDVICKWDDEDSCPDCPSKCENCIFNLNELQLTFKTISNTNLQNVNRPMGYNWDINTNLGIIGQKANETTNQIKANGEKIYEDRPKFETEENGEVGGSNVDLDLSGSGLAFSIRMTPDIIKDAREENKRQENYGGYANDSLTCYDYTDASGHVYHNLLCYSDYLDGLINRYGDKIDVRNRTTASSRGTDPNSTGYWEPWPNYVYSESVVGGPAWK